MLKGMMVAVVALAGALVPVAPAAAGGCADFEWDAPFYEAGQVATGRVEYLYYGGRVTTGGLEDGPYYAYLSPPGTDAGPPLSDAARRVAEVAVDPGGGACHQDATAELSFTVPDVAPGDYVIEVCNDPCEDTLGDMWLSPLRIVSSPETGRLSEAADRLDERMAVARYRVRRMVGQRIRELRRELLGEIDVLSDEVRAVTKRVHALERLRDQEPSPGRAALPLVGIVMGGLGLVWGLRRNRRPMRFDPSAAD